MAVPKRRKSHSRTRMQRSHDALSPTGAVVTCAQCREPKRLHHVCPNCGYYRSRQVVAKQDY